MIIRQIPAKTASNRCLWRFLPASAGNFTCRTVYLRPPQVILHVPVLQCKVAFTSLNHRHFLCVQSLSLDASLPLVNIERQFQSMLTASNMAGSSIVTVDGDTDGNTQYATPIFPISAFAYVSVGYLISWIVFTHYWLLPAVTQKQHQEHSQTNNSIYLLPMHETSFPS